ncbi:hypothetical protein OKW49_008212 [Paraburkholderia youngii]|uniref:ATP-binding protein n=1 Tax=Paraburkholderia youngii TaxID=2782701 RepID=UPI003D1CF4A8
MFARTTDLVQRLQVARRGLAVESTINRLDRFDLLILDDFAHVSKDQPETSILFELIGARYERRPVLLTANQLFGKRHFMAAWTELKPVSKVMSVTSSDADCFGHMECAIIEPQGPTELHTRIPTASCRRGVRAGYFYGQARAGARTESEFGVQVAPATAGGPCLMGWRTAQRYCYSSR